MKNLYTLLLSLISFTVCAQVRSGNPNYIWVAKEYSKDIAQHRAKNYLFRHVLGVDEKISKFELTPLAAASSGELTTLIYKSDDRDKEGLLLGFFGDYWNDAGVVYQGYAFKNLDKNQAYEFLEKISNAIDENNKYLRESSESNNIYFSYEDIDVIIFSGGLHIRLFWKNFDSNWDRTAFERSKRRFEKKTR